MADLITKTYCVLRENGAFTLMEKCLKIPPGEELAVSIDWDTAPKIQEIFTPWMELLEKNPQEKASFLALRPSFQKEFHAYFFRLKSETAVLKNLQRALAFLQNKTTFLGRS